MKPDQLPLAIRWPQQQRFDGYLSADNGAAVDLLQRAARDADAAWVFLSGAPASGKTHLLIAACVAAGEQGRSAQYICLRNVPQRAVATGAAPGDLAHAIRALGGSDLLAIDDLDAIAGNRAAEHALFDLYNRCKVEKSTLAFSGAQAPAQVGIALPDLVSRLAACVQVVVKPLDEGERRVVLAQRAAARGLTLDASVLDWLFAHHARDLRSLTALFERIDKAALAAQRRVTVPFLRKLLGGQD
jgi:DnaA family protein